MGEVYFKLNLRDGKIQDPKPASGRTAFEAFRKAFKVEISEEDLGPRITSVNDRKFDTYHYFVLDPKTGKRYVPYMRTLYGKKKYLDLRHILLTPEMAGMVIEITLIKSQKDNRHSVVRRFDGVFSSFNLEEIRNIDMACSMCEISAPRQILRARETDGAGWVLMLRRQAFLFDGFSNRKMIRPPEVSYALPSVKFNSNPASPAQQGARQAFLPSQEMPASSCETVEQELVPLNLPEPSSPKPGRKPLGRFILGANMQLDGITVRESPPSRMETPSNSNTAVQIAKTLLQKGQILLADENTPKNEVRQGAIAPSEAPFQFQMLRAAIQTGRQASPEIKSAPLPEEKTRKAGAVSAKIARQHGKTGRSPPRAKSRTSFVPLSSITSFKAAIFDFDGVVVDSMELHRRSFNALLAPLGIRIAKKEFMKSCSGVPAEKILERIFKKHGIHRDVKQWSKKRNDIYGRYLYDAKLQPIAGFLDFYDMLVANGVKVAVASSGEGQHIHAALESIGVRGVPVISIQHVKRGKPAPDLFLLAAKRLKAKRGQVVVFEDAPSGLAAAKRAKMPAIALATSLPAKSLKGKAGLIAKDFRSKKLKQLFSSLLGRR